MSVGSLLLSLAMPASVYSLVTAAIGGPDAWKNSRRFAHIATALILLASAMLVFAFATDSFNIEYVYSYSSRALPLVYKLSGLWAGLDGSLLFWVLILAMFTSWTNMRTSEAGRHALLVNAVLQAIIVFFLAMLVFEANPFAEIAPAPHDGKGLNPLLQNFFMIIHPPALYLGYVGFAVPFAYVIAGLILKKGSDEYLKEMRLWTIVSWFFLTLGNLLGAMWAYVELGWGGFWAWDPVENAGIMPWFTATAFLHSIIMQERRGMLKMWNNVLIILTFLLTIFGTFITRSGIIRSVHSFSDVTIGMYFIVFLSIASFYCLYLVLSRRKEIGGKNKLETIMSREGAFYLNSFLLIFGLTAMTWGTMLPLFAELFTGQKMEVGPEFFNRTMAPIGAAILVLTGICPGLSWRNIQKDLFRRELMAPCIFAALAGIMALALGMKKWFPLTAIAGAVFVAGAVADECARAIPVTARRFNIGIFRSALGLFRAAPRRFGGYIIHLGVAVMFIGIAGSSYQGEYPLTLNIGSPQSAGGYEFTLDSIKIAGGQDSEGAVASVAVAKGGRQIAVLAPALFLHRDQPKPIAEIDLVIKPLKDIYLAMGSIYDDGKTAEFLLTINPLISFVWFGGALMILGAIIAIIPRRGKDTDSENEIELDVSLGRAKKEDFI